MDLVVDYPAENVAFIGLFMMDKALQGKGAGSRIVSECEKKRIQKVEACHR